MLHADLPARSRRRPLAHRRPASEAAGVGHADELLRQAARQPTGNLLARSVRLVRCLHTAVAGARREGELVR
jgi:hypothetical protein